MARKRHIPRRQQSTETPTSSFDPRTLLCVCMLAGVVGLSYIPLFSNGFVDFDDPEYITGNPFIRSGLTADSWTWAWTTLRAGNWHPLTWISHAMDVTFFGLNPSGHHFTNLLIHYLNALLLFLLLSRATREKTRSLVVAALFGVHPLAVESVAWAAERKNVLCTLLFLLAIGAYGRYARRSSALTYVGVMVMFGLALAAKPMAITLPFVLLLLDFWPLARVAQYTLPNRLISQRTIGTLVVEKLPLIVMSLGSAIVTLVAQSSSGAVASTTTLPMIPRVENTLYSYFHYVISALYPVSLVPFYPRTSISAGQLILACVFLASVTAVAWLMRRNHSYLLVCWLFYLGTLVPVIGLVQVGEQSMADRYTYIPMIGIFVALVWLADDYAKSHHLPVAIRLGVPTISVLVLVALTWRQVSRWHDDITLWSYNLAVTPDNVVAEDNLGIALLKAGHTDAALPHFYHANKLATDDPISATNVATDLLAHGQTRSAIEKYQAALDRAAFVPMLLPTIHSNLGSAFLTIGDVNKAREHYKVALDLNPNDTVARAGLKRIEEHQSSSIQ